MATDVQQHAHSPFVVSYDNDWLLRQRERLKVARIGDLPFMGDVKPRLLPDSLHFGSFRYFLFTNDEGGSFVCDKIYN
jgi:hypothetical protein